MASIRSNRRSIFAGTIAVLMVLLLSAVQDRAQGLQSEPVLLGAAVHGDQPTLLDQLETDIGRQLDVVRVFTLWDTPFPSADDLELFAGRKVVLSIKPLAGGEHIPWSDIAAAQPGDPLHDDMVAWANALKPFEDRLYLTFMHEPEAASNLPHGTATDFIAAWRRFMTVMDDEGLVPLGRVWIMTDYSFHVPATDRRHAPKWYPGDQWVDAAAIDAYNWHQCRAGINTQWKTLSQIIEPFRVWGLDHPDEVMMLTEVGTVEDAAQPGRKAAWIDEARALLQDGNHDQFELMAWFNLNGTSPGIACDWRITTSATSLHAFATLADDPFYGGTGGSIPTTTTTTTTPPEPFSCSLNVVAGSATLAWVDDGSTFVVRRNGDWLATPGSGVSSYVDDPSPPDASYVLVAWEGALRTAVTCAADPGTTTTTTTTTTTSTTTTTTTVPPDSGCQSQTVGDDVVLAWADEGGIHVLRRNGSWLTTPGSGVSTYTDVGAPAGASYELRTWLGGERIDRLCS
ncbi:MAG: hypothetical protein WCC01_15295 [Acidimicrobiia bacterium]